MIKIIFPININLLMIINMIRKFKKLDKMKVCLKSIRLGFKKLNLMIIPKLFLRDYKIKLKMMKLSNYFTIPFMIKCSSPARS